MRISLLQPCIKRGDAEYNLAALQALIDRARGEFLVTAEYVLTGSLVLDQSPDIERYLLSEEDLMRRLRIPEGKRLLVDHIERRDGKVYNSASLLPAGGRQDKLYPDETEAACGVVAGSESLVFEEFGARFKVLVCMDMRYQDRIDFSNLDFVLWLYHFTEANYGKKMADAQACARRAGLPLFVSSLVSDVNSGMSGAIFGERAVSLSGDAGILEIEL
jgi:predicted amidohydrolase